MTDLSNTLLSEVLIVDAQPDDYRRIASRPDQENVTFYFARSGHDALQLSQQSRVQTWLVNLHLPDMTGLELLDVVRGRYPATTFLLVGDTYSATDELAVRTAGATAYLCKPVDGAWLSQIVATRFDDSIRAGPVRAPG